MEIVSSARKGTLDTDDRATELQVHVNVNNTHHFTSDTTAVLVRLY